ncbi:MAG: hypothetical protein P4N24_03540 [Acidobacteriota bacterium]|nr:hypothetical protein [Acidobacteriota bacterium]
MEQRNDSIRDRLLSRLPQPANLAAYREEVASMLEKNEKAYRRKQWVTGAFLLFAVGFVTVPLSLNWLRLDTPKGISYAFLAFLLYLYAMAEVLKLFINRNRVEILREVKQVQLQVLELQASLQKSGDQ